VIVLLLLFSEPAHAYIGPGAGFALLSSLFALLVSFPLAFFSMFAMPFRLICCQIFDKAQLNTLLKKVFVFGINICDRPSVARTILLEFLPL